MASNTNLVMFSIWKRAERRTCRDRLRDPEAALSRSCSPALETSARGMSSRIWSHPSVTRLPDPQLRAIADEVGSHPAP
jgi:hypothetical protein